MMNWVQNSDDGGAQKAQGERKRMKSAESVNKNRTPSKSWKLRKKQHHLDEPGTTPSRRSQKIGDKITALQQLVCPFGKTATASVLKEAALCINSLHHQLENLTAPYLGITSSEDHHQNVEVPAEGSNGDLLSRGLCLVPVFAIVELTMDDQSHC